MPRRRDVPKRKIIPDPKFKDKLVAKFTNCLMLGGTPRSIEIFEPFARILAADPERGWLHCGPSGAGHYAKMIHNGIEYGMMQALAEGFALLAAKPELDIDTGRLAQTWRHGSVVRSWLLDLCATILEENEELAGVAPVIDDSGSGRWTALESIELGVPAPVITTTMPAGIAKTCGSSPLAAIAKAGTNT